MDNGQLTNRRNTPIRPGGKDGQIGQVRQGAAVVASSPRDLHGRRGPKRSQSFRTGSNAGGVREGGRYGFTGPRIHWFTGSRAHEFTGSRIHEFTGSRIHGFTGVPRSRTFPSVPPRSATFRYVPLRSAAFRFVPQRKRRCATIRSFDTDGCSENCTQKADGRYHSIGCRPATVAGASSIVPMPREGGYEISTAWSFRSRPRPSARRSWRRSSSRTQCRR
jgi:hypothetical protein